MHEMKEFNYQYIYKSPMLRGYEKYFRRLLRLIYDYLTGLLQKNGFDGQLYMQEGNMLSAGFFNYVMEKKTLIWSMMAIWIGLCLITLQA